MCVCVCVCVSIYIHVCIPYQGIHTGIPPYRASPTTCTNVTNNDAPRLTHQVVGFRV